jgi:dihydroorotate dehydrogenase electron transfer subunit
MHTGKGQITELLLDDGFQLAQISCPQALIPAPGQYLLASHDSNIIVPVPLFYTESALDSFLALLHSSESWRPGQELHLRGPFGRGFSMPATSRRVVLAAFDNSVLLLRGLMHDALKHGAAVVVLADSGLENLPDDVEVQPVSALDEVMKWADYAAFVVSRENFSGWKERFGMSRQASVTRKAQVLVRTPVPCGGIAECGVCAVSLNSGWKMACKDGPVFQMDEL